MKDIDDVASAVSDYLAGHEQIPRWAIVLFASLSILFSMYVVYPNNKISEKVPLTEEQILSQILWEESNKKK